MTYLYSELANNFVERIEKGIYLPGDRIPGVRQTSMREGVSPATVVSAYRHLELEGYIEPRPRSGFYVRTRFRPELPEPRPTKLPVKPKPVSGQELVVQLIQTINIPGIVLLGANIPDESFMPTREVSRALMAVSKNYRRELARYEVPPGLLELRLEIAKKMASIGTITSPDNVVITSGCQEALYLSLKATTHPGDVIAIESPTYYGLLQIIDSLGLKALEIPSDIHQGISIEALQLALDQWPVKACVVIPNFSNPLGTRMPDERKQALVDLANKYRQLVLIEDDIYGDIYFEGRRPDTLKSRETQNNIIYCASFSKNLAPDLRIGWICSDRFQPRIEYEKFVNNCATSTFNQLVVARLLSRGVHERHLRSMRIAVAQSAKKLSECVTHYFPAETRLTRPSGGLALWLELPKSVDATQLSHAALEHNISIAPGSMFSNTTKYKHCIRLNCAVAWSSRVEAAIEILGELVSAAAPAKHA